MAAPNIVQATSMYGKTAVQAVTTSATAIVTNSAASGKVLKINTLIVANVNASNAAALTVDVYRGSTAYRIAASISIPVASALTPIDKTTTIYLEEGDSLRLTAALNNYLEAVCSYEEIS